MKNPRILELGKGDEIFQYFTNNLSNNKKLLIPILFPLSALIEELIYRSLILSFLIYYLNVSSIFGIIFASLIFGIVHLSASKNWGHVISTLLSSIIYFIALIQLGILYSWGFHLTTNIFVLLFYYLTRRKKERLLFDS
ncbi:MAG: lysostaphin resistance A-like protein [Candidatus Hodarchaeota archaeon]